MHNRPLVFSLRTKPRLALPLLALFALSGMSCVELVPAKKVAKQAEDSSDKGTQGTGLPTPGQPATNTASSPGDHHPTMSTPGASATTAPKPDATSTEKGPSSDAVQKTNQEPEATTSTAPKKEEGTTSETKEDKTTTTKDEATTTTTKDDPTTKPDKDTSAPETCASKGGMCVAKAPSGWTGPIRVFDSRHGTPERCSLPFLKDLGTLHSELSPATMKCECECNPKMDTFDCERGLEYDKKNARIYMFEDPACQTVKYPESPSAVVFTTSKCQGKPKKDWGSLEGQEFGIPQHIKFVRPPVIAEKAECSPQNKAVKTQDHQWSRSTRLCQYSEPSKLKGLCQSNQQCVQNNHLNALCIYRRGKHSCPSSEWQHHKVLFEDKVQDNRDCSGCKCGSGTGECADRYWFGGCSDEADFEIKQGDCVKITGRRYFTEHKPGPVINARCEATPGTLSGEVKPTAAWTICCASS